MKRRTVAYLRQSPFENQQVSNIRGISVEGCIVQLETLFGIIFHAHNLLLQLRSPHTPKIMDIIVVRLMCSCKRFFFVFRNNSL